MTNNLHHTHNIIQTDNFTLQPLEWDSTQLGVITGKITTDINHLPEALSQARTERYELIYWNPEEHPIDEEKITQLMKNYHGTLVDDKTTYLINLSEINLNELKNQLNLSDLQPSFYTQKFPSEDLIQLAYESGNYSRFRKDPYLTDNQFKAVYQEWIKNSVNHSIADDVLIIQNNHAIAGMITLGEKNHRGDIGLLAVSEKARGKKLGTLLVQAAQNYFIEKNFTYSQVVTQKNNIPACKLYEKCGYHIEKIERFYHFWPQR